MLQNQSSVFLETQRLFIRVPKMEDLDDQLVLQSHPEVMRYIGDGPRNRQEVREGLEKAVKHFEKFKFSLGSVFEKNSQKFIGRAGLIHLGYNEAAPEIEVGYALLPDYWRKGYASELASALIQWGFSSHSIPEIVAVTRPENLGSRAVLEKAGMKFQKETEYYGKQVVFYSKKRSGF